MDEYISWTVNHLLYLVPILAFIIDCIVGDPRSNYHPVVLIGKVISFYEKIFYHEKDTNKRKFLYGACTVIATLVTVVLIGGIILMIAAHIADWLVSIVSAIILYITITPRSLAEAGHELFVLLKKGDIKEARRKVGWIVGRKTDDLDESEITRATIETVAENTVDGILSPLFWFALFGPLGALFYRTANTMDSMLGYKNDRYLYFGRVAARFDDIVNYIPARIGFLLFVFTAFIINFDGIKAWKIGLRDAKKHPSPNGGWAEAPVAGALHIRLGGYNVYHNRTTFREYMGDPIETMRGIHIQKTITMMYWVTVEAIILTTLGMYIFNHHLY